MKPTRARRATSLVELLVAAVMLGIIVPSIVATLYATRSNTNLAERRATAMGYVQAQLEQIRSTTATTPPTIGTTNSTVTVEGLRGPVQLERRVSLVAGYSDLYDVRLTLTWPEPSLAGTRTDRVVLSGWVRSPDV